TKTPCVCCVSVIQDKSQPLIITCASFGSSKPSNQAWGVVGLPAWQSYSWGEYSGGGGEGLSMGWLWLQGKRKEETPLELPQELSRVHHTFHVSNLKKCYADKPLVMPLEGIHVDDKLPFVEEPVEIMEQEIKRLKRSQIPLVKVR
ncbi:hypothetical protein Tco_1495525, partial [Tanacetum coccineum]